MDRAVEEWLRPRLEELYPAAIWGEEFGLEGDHETACWMIDPIDGTSNYVFGLPLWGTTVGLRIGKQIVAGVVALPDLGKLYSGSLGDGAFCNGDSMPKCKPGPLQRYHLVGYTHLDMIPVWQPKVGGKGRVCGACVIEAMFLADGGRHSLVLGRTCLYDVAGSLAVLQELGFEFTLLKTGEPWPVGDGPVPGLLADVLIHPPVA
jgi:myo-inositol-1(or 4)-monophosphatase